MDPHVPEGFRAPMTDQLYPELRACQAAHPKPVGNTGKLPPMSEDGPKLADALRTTPPGMLRIKGNASERCKASLA
jgi:hypothetical protein